MSAEKTRSPWPALWALVIGFFMLLVDVTIVSVANPAIKAALDPESANLDRIVWVTSAYLLAYAVPLLVTGRLGDRFGPKNLYLTGLALFTLASLWCGLSTTLEGLIAARVVQGLGAAAMSPQTMAIITRTFPPHRRGAAMGVWGSVAGVASLAGPLLGGLLVDSLGWEWIFFVNLPIGVIAFALAVIFVPRLETHPHRFDVLGVVLSALALFLIVFGLQEGQTFRWGVIWGPVSVWSLIVTGVIVLLLFLVQQSRTRSEALVPLALFRDRNFAWSNVGIAAVGFSITSMSLPLMFFFQLARGYSPTESAVLLIPSAVISGVLAPFVGAWFDRVDPRAVMIPGISLVAIALGAYAMLMNMDSPTWMLLLPSALLGIGSAGMWGPLATVATRGLPHHQAGAGAGIYNTTRTVGSVIGSAAIAAFMQFRLEANVPGLAEAPGAIGREVLPPAIAPQFAASMAQAMLLSAAVILVTLVAAFFTRRTPRSAP